jgi:predicted transcriptional regulator
MNDEKLLNLLEDIGFNQVEATVYLALLRGSSQTGYKIASSVGKSRSNVYQALKTLEQKGVIVQLQANGNNKQFRAVPIEQVLEQKENDFQVKKEMISAAFSHLQQDEEDDQIYSLNTVSQVYAEAIKMVNKTKEIIFVDAGILQLSKIKSALEEATTRGVKVILLDSNGDCQITGCNIIKYQYYVAPGKTYEPWNLDWFCLAADGDTFLIATFVPDKDELIYALSSSNIYISGWIYSDMLYEMAFSHIVSLFKKGLNRDEIWEGINDYSSRFFDRAPGIKRLQEKFAVK